MELKIEKNVPIPPIARGAQKNPNSFSGKLRALKKGESLLVPDKYPGAVRSHVAKVLGHGNYAMRAENSGTRVWRTK